MLRSSLFSDRLFKLLTDQLYMQEQHADEISYQGLTDKAANEEYVYAVFHRDDCEHCESFIPASEEPLTRINIVYSDAKLMNKEEKQDCKEKYSIALVPTVVYFKSKEPDDVLIGEVNDKELEGFMKGKKQ